MLAWEDKNTKKGQDGTSEMKLTDAFIRRVNGNGKE